MARLSGRGGDIPSVALLVSRFAVAGLVALVVVVLASVGLSRAVGQRVALTEARRVARLTGTAIVAPAIDAAVMAGDARALDELNELINRGVLDGSLVRVKLWLPGEDSGQIIYSDESRLIGETHPFDERKLRAVITGDAVAEETDLSEPENRFEASESRLLEVYLPITTPAGDTLLWETYFDRRRVDEAGQEVWRSVATPLIGGLVALQLIQIPLAWSLARRLRSSAIRREQLLESSIESSALERRRIAADLHDGVVQDLAGASFELAAAAKGDDVEELRAATEEGAQRLRASVGALRSMLVDIYPPNLAEAGLATTLEDFLARHRSAGLTAELEADVHQDIPLRTAQLVYRIAQETLRNIDKHASATRVTVRLTARDGLLRLVVDDDGVGVDLDQVKDGVDGHFGLRLLADSTRDLGGRLEMASAPGEGTTVELEVPL